MVELRESFLSAYYEVKALFTMSSRRNFCWRIFIPVILSSSSWNFLDVACDVRVAFGSNVTKSCLNGNLLLGLMAALGI